MNESGILPPQATKRRNGRARSWIRCAGGAALLAALASCKTGPDYARPALDVPAAYKSNTGAEMASLKLRPDWWQVFNDPDLNALEDEALRANQGLKAAMARVAQARAAARAVKSGFYPVIGAEPSATRSRRADLTQPAKKQNSTLSELQALSSALQQAGSPTVPISGGTSRTGTTTTTTTAGTTSAASNLYELPFDLSYEIDIWGRVRRSYEAAQAQALASDYDLETVRETLLADVAQNYFNLRALDDQDEILDRNVALYTEEVDLTQLQLKAGLVSDVNVFQAKALLEATRAQEIDYVRQRTDLEHALAILLGRPAADFALAARPLDQTPPIIPAGLPADILRSRPDVAEAEENLAASSAKIGVAMANFYPVVKLTGTAGFESIDLQHVVDWKSRFWSFGPSASIPIFQGGQLRAELRQAKAKYDEDEANYRNTVLTAFADVENALTDLHSRADESVAQTAAVDAAHGYLQMTQVQYKNGLANHLQVIDAERTVLTNELTAAQILNQRMVSTVLLIKALGGGWNTQAPPTAGVAGPAPEAAAAVQTTNLEAPAPATAPASAAAPAR